MVTTFLLSGKKHPKVLKTKIPLSAKKGNLELTLTAPETLDEADHAVWETPDGRYRVMYSAGVKGYYALALSVNGFGRPMWDMACGNSLDALYTNTVKAVEALEARIERDQYIALAMQELAKEGKRIAADKLRRKAKALQAEADAAPPEVPADEPVRSETTRMRKARQTRAAQPAKKKPAKQVVKTKPTKKPAAKKKTAPKKTLKLPKARKGKTGTRKRAA